MTNAFLPGRAVVLIVEDEPISRRATTDLFEDEGFEVLEASDGGEALAILGDRRDVGLLFMGVEMLDTPNGYGLERWAHRHRPAVKTVIVSGRACPGTGDFPAGATFIGKPCGLGDVMRRVQTMMTC